MTLGLEYQTRLSRLFAEHYGVGGEGLRRRAKAVSRYLSPKLVQDLQWLVDAILSLKAGGTVADPAAFRREADTILTALATVPAGEIAERNTMRRRLRFLLHGLIVVSPVLAVIGWIGYQTEAHFREGHLEWIFGSMAAAYVLWPGYLFRWLDRVAADRFSGSRLESPARTLLLAAFFWSPGPWIVAFLGYPRDEEPFTLEAYIERHPDCYRNGRIYCYRCGSSNIWMGLHSAIFFHYVYSHTCRQCGLELYQSSE